jgi:D-alanine transaminase
VLTDVGDSPSVVYLNGGFRPAAQACIPVTDRGFLFGDGVYEVIPVYGGRLFRLDPHLDRLDRSLAAIRLPNPLERGQWRAMLEELVTRNGAGDLSVYLQVTRGAPATRDHAFPADVPATVLAMASPLKPLAASVLDTGIEAVTLDDIRWQACHIKAITLLANVLLRQQAIDQGGQEAILIRDGNAVEGAASNLFVVKGRALQTPPTGPWLLGGITRELILELAPRAGVTPAEVPIPAGELAAADEIWLTSSTREILPVTRLDGEPVGDGLPGAVWQRMFALYQESKRSGGRMAAGA